MRCDYHIHTSFSLDSQTPLLDQYKRAAEVGLSEICFTDHSEHNIKNEPSFFALDIPAYKKAVSELPDLGVRVKWGCEYCMLTDETESLRHAELVRAGGFDFVLASVHMVAEGDPYYPEFYTNRTASQVNALYVEALARYVRRTPVETFSAIGHVDYGSKFNPDKTAVMRYSDCPDALDDLFRFVVENGKCIEINTSMYRKLGREIPGHDWLARYRELGGEFVTFGSDSHTIEHIGYRLEDAVELAKAAGIRYFAAFDAMKPTMHKL